MSDDLRRVAYRAEATLLELKDMLQNGPVIKIVHRFWVPGTECLPGEEIWGMFLVVGTREILLPLTLAMRMLLNYLAETRHIQQSATQIAAGIHENTFYSEHGGNSSVVSRRKITRTAVKEYVKRLRMAFLIAFRDAVLDVHPDNVIVSRHTVGNEVHYELCATVQWVHVP